MSERTNPLIRITPSAWMKIQALVVGYDKEVGWYTTVDKIGKLEYRITDILVYPQISTSTHVEDTIVGDDATEMNEWYDTLTDEQYSKRRGHGHSHVNMSVSPSSTDKEFCETFALSMKHAINPYVITMIINKKLEMMWWVCDWEEGQEFTNYNIDVVIEVEEGVTNVEFFMQSKELVRNVQTFKSSAYYMFGGNESPQRAAGTAIFPKSRRTNKKSEKLDKKVEEKPKTEETPKESEPLNYTDWDFSYIVSVDQAGISILTSSTELPITADHIMLEDHELNTIWLDLASYLNAQMDSNSAIVHLYENVFEHPDIFEFHIMDEERQLLPMFDPESILNALTSEVVSTLHKDDVLEIIVK